MRVHGGIRLLKAIGVIRQNPHNTSYDAAYNIDSFGREKLGDKVVSMVTNSSQNGSLTR